MTVDPRVEAAAKALCKHHAFDQQPGTKTSWLEKARVALQAADAVEGDRLRRFVEETAREHCHCVGESGPCSVCRARGLVVSGGGVEPSREDRDFTVTGDELDLCLARAEAAEARVVELTAALRFYAQQSNYWYDETCVPMRGNEGDVLGDNGERARAALAAAGEGGK